VSRKAAPADYERRVRDGPCFVCELLAGRNPHHVVYEDDGAIAFLNRYPTVRGYTLVAPKAHLTQVTGDFDEDGYASLQRVVHRVGEAVRRSVPCERLYVLSLGSEQGNAHVHWHLVPLPPGVPYREQQLAALDWNRTGVLDLGDDEQAGLARRVRDLVQNRHERGTDT
jgi:diadenosine tetraphosphate (Ap4A) HIT family hydrolase